MTVGELEATMSNDEFIHWVMYYQEKQRQQWLADIKAKRKTKG